MIGLLEDMMTVWTFAGFSALAVGGFLVGALYLSRVRFLTTLDSSAYARLVFAETAFTGTVFFVGQIIDSALQDPAHVDRVVSRYLLWLMFSAAVAIGSRHRFWR
jgi:hypothetical protein